MMINERLQALGIALPPVFPPAGSYVGCVVDEGLVYVGGHGPTDGTTVITGNVGGEPSIEQGREAPA